MTIWTLDDLHHALSAATSRGNARTAVRRAARIVGVDSHEPLGTHELVRICAALSAEGGAIQQLAEGIASEALRDQTRNAA